MPLTCTRTARSGRIAIFVRMSETDTWVQVESVHERDRDAAEALVEQYDDDADLRYDAIEDNLGSDWGLDAPVRHPGA